MEDVKVAGKGLKGILVGKNYAILVGKKEDLLVCGIKRKI